MNTRVCPGATVSAAPREPAIRVVQRLFGLFTEKSWKLEPVQFCVPLFRMVTEKLAVAPWLSGLGIVWATTSALSAAGVPLVTVTGMSSSAPN